MISVRIPAATRKLAVAVPEYRDETTARFDQTPRCQTFLAEQRLAVAFPQGQRLTADIQGVAHLAGHDQGKGHAAKLIEPVITGMGFPLHSRPIELLQQRAAQVQALA